MKNLQNAAKTNANSTKREDRGMQFNGYSKKIRPGLNTIA